MSDQFKQSRRRFLRGSATVGGIALAGLPDILRAQQAPPVIASDGVRPMASWGLQIGDVLADRAIVWSRPDKPARMLVEWSLDEDFRDAIMLRGPYALDTSDLTSRIDLAGLPPDEQIFVRVIYEDLDSGKARSEPVPGRFRTAPRTGYRSSRRRDLRFLWSGDTAGQGWGIDLAFGGMKIYEAMRRTEPDFFIHSGDTIYADGPMVERPTTPDGSSWVNAFLDVVPEKLEVAETLQEFHRNHLYNRYDANVQRFSAEVPQIWQWDDHEVVNNWSDSKDLSGDVRYSEKRVQTLIARATKAFLDYAPMRWQDQEESERVYRHIAYGRDLDVFVIDMRSYRGPNTANLQPEPGAETEFLGRTQIDWLKRRLDASRATWKVIAADMPIGLQVPDGSTRWEAIANGNNGPALGRELEIADLLRFVKRKQICNVVWLTADVHYCAAHYYDPGKAQFTDFDPFWEFVSGPLNAGSFGPNALDATFGPQVVFSKAPPAGGPVNLPPSAGLQFFGQVDIDSRSKDMVVALKDIDGNEVFSQRLHARPCKGWGRDD
jgi:alkaline phosphatase D